MGFFDLSTKGKGGDQSATELAAPRPAMPIGVSLSCEDTQRRTSSKSISTYRVYLENVGTNADTFIVETSRTIQSSGEEDLEWQMEIKEKGKLIWDSAKMTEFHREVHLDPGKRHLFLVDIVTPSGASFGDRLDVDFVTTSKTQAGVKHWIQISATARLAFLAIKTQIGQERAVAETLAARAREKNLKIASLLSPSPLRGYLIMETMNSDLLHEVIKGIRKARGIVDGETSFDDIQHYLTPKPTTSGIVESDIVELISGPFKGEKARVRQIDYQKEEITVELLEATVPIPVTVRGDHVRVLEKDSGSDN